MRRRNLLQCALLAAAGLFVGAGHIAAAANTPDGDKPALAGKWTMNNGETKIEFPEKNVLKIAPHGDTDVLLITCEYSLDKEGHIKAKITDLDGTVKEKAKEVVPVGTEFRFKWTAKDKAAKLEDVKCDKADHLKAHLEGEYTAAPN